MICDREEMVMKILRGEDLEREKMIVSVFRRADGSDIIILNFRW